MPAAAECCAAARATAGEELSVPRGNAAGPARRLEQRVRPGSIVFRGCKGARGINPLDVSVRRCALSESWALLTELAQGSRGTPALPVSWKGSRACLGSRLTRHGFAVIFTPEFRR